MIKISKLKPNQDNPRNITDEELEELKNKIASFEDMLTVSQIVVDENWLVLGGNQRLKALKLLGYKEIPADWIRVVDDYTEEQKRDFIVIDNIHEGHDDLDVLKSLFTEDDLKRNGFAYLTKRKGKKEKTNYNQREPKNSRSVALEFKSDYYEEGFRTIHEFKNKGIDIGEELKEYLQTINPTE